MAGENEAAGDASEPGRKISRRMVFGLIAVLMLQGFGPIFVYLFVYYPACRWFGHAATTEIGFPAAVVACAASIAWYIAVVLLAGRIPAACKSCGARLRFSGWLVGCYKYRCEQCGDKFVVQFDEYGVNVETG